MSGATKTCSPIGRARSRTITGGEQQVTGDRRSYSSAEPLPRPGNLHDLMATAPDPKMDRVTRLLTDLEGQLER